MGAAISAESAMMLFPNSEIDKSKHLPNLCGYISTPEKDLEILQVPFVSQVNDLKELLIFKGKNL